MIIERGMEYGFYQGVNFDSAYCNDCGTHSLNVMLKCPKCGSSNMYVISRVCGYCGYYSVNGHTRMNDEKMEEICHGKYRSLDIREADIHLPLFYISFLFICYYTGLVVI